MITELSSLTDIQAKIKKDDIVLFDFWASWCSPCKQLTPHFQKKSEEYTNIPFVTVNVDDSDSPIEFGIRSVPTILAFHKGQLVGTFCGPTVHNQLDTFLASELCNSIKETS